jgi:hypothetical protein
MVKSVEDKRNLAYDTEHGLVRVILLVEDSIQYYSLFLPLLYEEIVKQTQILIREELNDINKRLRMRVRPKVILAHNYEEAIKIYEQYKEYIIAVISDISYERNRKVDPNAGIKLISEVKKNIYDVPTILMSSDSNNRLKAEKINSTFIDKYSKHLLQELRQFMLNNIGFGDFIFRNEAGTEIDRARTLFEFEQKLKTIPDESILYHSRRNHFSAWLMARGETRIAKQMRLLTIKDFKTTADMRKHLEDTLHYIRKSRTKGKIINFYPASSDETNQIIRLAEGSLGGKGRSLAFLNALLNSMEFERRFPLVNIELPGTQIIGTNEFDDFIRNNNITERVTEQASDTEIDHIFISGQLSAELIDKLRIFIHYIMDPIAVRSSGLLEDSFSQPFAGIYRTYMLPNNHPNPKVRLEQLCSAIKLVFASVFIQSSRTYIENLQHKLEEEKMAVLIQQVVGSRFGDYFYPHISGIAQSYNFYPIANLQNTDGIASVVVGLGKAVIEGEKHFRFCPKFPKVDFLEPKGLLIDSQKDIYGIDLQKKEFDLINGVDVTISRIGLNEAEPYGALKRTTSVWDYNNNRISPDLSLVGPRIINFADVLKYDNFPLANIIVELLEIGEIAFGMPVEIEFAVNLTRDSQKNQVPTFYILQIRPLAVTDTDVDIKINTTERNKIFLYTDRAMGNGIIKNICDIILLQPEKFDNLHTLEIQKEIEYLNDKMKRQKQKYILIGPGRWGSIDRFLGIPVRFMQISNAKIIVEMGLQDFNIDPSQGTHFFHNIIAMQIGYFNLPFNSSKIFVDWAWLKEQKIYNQTEHFIHYQLDHPFVVKMNGKSGEAVIYK